MRVLGNLCFPEKLRIAFFPRKKLEMAEKKCNVLFHGMSQFTRNNIIPLEPSFQNAYQRMNY